MSQFEGTVLTRQYPSLSLCPMACDNLGPPLPGLTLLGRPSLGPLSPAALGGGLGLGGSIPQPRACHSTRVALEKGWILKEMTGQICTRYPVYLEGLQLFQLDLMMC